MKSVGNLKAMKAEKYQGNKLQIIDDRKQELSEQLSEIHSLEIILLKFHLSYQNAKDEILVSIINGSLAYMDKIVRDCPIKIENQSEKC
ncbi:MAG: hypothetical protein LBF44_00995 [Holosporaceae bacterium]|jgi:hypothetical protein|nr:hypothetical protein [Holosporaceae bacterium]